MIRIPTLLIALSFLSACHSDKKAPVEQANASTLPKITLPNSPETVVTSWENWIAKNQFEYAKLVSTDQELEFVVTLAKSQEMKPIPELQTQVANLHCTTVGDSSTCSCTVRDAKLGDMNYVYFLIKKSGQWFLRDVQPDDSSVNGEKKKLIE